jgi:AAA domain
MTMKFTTTDQAGTTHGHKVLVYSESGVGKTVLCSTAPSPVIVSAEAGLLSLRKVKIPVIEIKTLADLRDAFNWACTSKDVAAFETICLDSVTEIAEVLLADLIKTKGQNDPRKAYGELVPQMSEIIRAFRDLPGKNVYFSAKVEPIKDELSGTVKYGPSMPGQKLGPLLPYFFDEVFRLGIGKGQDGTLYRFLQTQPDLQYIAKDRSGSLAVYEPPDLSAVFKKIQA